MPWRVRCFRGDSGGRPKRQATPRGNVAGAVSRSRCKRLLVGSCRQNGGRRHGKKPMVAASVAARLFFPHSQALGIAPDDTVSPAVLRKMVYAGSHASSFRQASEDLREEAELEISEQRIMRATKRIGQERIGQREAEVCQWEGLSLPEQRSSPKEQVPAVAVVEMDGGRMQIRDERFGQPPEGEPDEPEASRKGRFWRETKVGCLLTAASTVSAEDPCPEIPRVFVDPRKMRQIAREIKGIGVEGPEDTSSCGEAESDERPGRPTVLVRSVVATREKIEEFGKQLAAAAWRRGFAAASRKAFVADGLEANWSTWRRHFSHYTPIVDFIHALCYVFAAALAARRLPDGWPIYCQWAQWLWSGRVEMVIAAVRQRQQEVGLPEPNESEDSPRAKVAAALGYLENQQSRMKYDAYRREGLPITSSHIESTIKQINRRVKGTEKFWSEGGAESLLQLAADYLSETTPIATFWRERPTLATGQRHYLSAS